jgi:hypothetical protein
VECGFFSCFWYAYTASRDVPQDVWAKADKQALLYFREYQNRLLPNPVIRKEFFPDLFSPVKRKGVTQIREIMQPRMLHHLSMALAEDLEMSTKYD